MICPLGSGLVSKVRSADVLLAEGAIEFFSEQIRAKPKDAFSFSIRGMLRHDKNELDAALADYNQAIEIDSKCALAYHGRGQIWYGKREYDKAIGDFNRAVKLNPEDAELYKDRAWAWISKDEFDNALRDCNDAIRLEGPFDTDATWLRGVVWRNKKEYDKAIADFTLVIIGNPDSILAYASRGWIWYKKDEFDKALDDFDKAIKLNPKLCAAYVDRGDTWWALDQSAPRSTTTRRLSDWNRTTAAAISVADSRFRILTSMKRRSRILIKLFDADPRIGQTASTTVAFPC